MLETDHDYQATNTEYGGLDIRVSNVVFVHGSIDPWHAMGIIQSNRTKSPAIYIQGEIKLKIMLLSDLHLTLRHGSLRQHVPGLGLRSAAINRGEDADWSTHKTVGWSVNCNTGLNFYFPLFNINMKMPFLSFIKANTFRN